MALNRVESMGNKKITSGKGKGRSLSKKRGPIVWAVDSSKLDDDMVVRMQKALMNWKLNEQEIIPATVFSHFDMGLIVEPGKKFKAHVLRDMEAKIQEKWRQHNISFKSSGFLASAGNSLRDKAQALVNFAKQSKAEVIVTGSGAKSRQKIVGIGSFAETLISISSVPVLVVGESVKKVEPISTVLYPTDFSEASRHAFDSLMGFARKYQAEVVLYHYLDLESGPLAFGISWGYEVKWIEEFWEDQEKRKREQGKKWTDWAQKQGVICHFVCDRSLGGLRNRILETASDSKANLIAVGITRGPLSQVILGHGVRGLFAYSSCPVLAIHSKAQIGKLHS